MYIETLKNEKKRLETKIEELEKQLLTLHESVGKVNKEINNLDVKQLLEKRSEIFSSLEIIIKKYHVEHPDRNKVVYKVYSDGQIDFCRNILRGNWHKYKDILLARSYHVRHLNFLFPKIEVNTAINGILNEDRYITCYKEHAHEIYNAMKDYATILNHSNLVTD
jgi:hypothetical protein